MPAISDQRIEDFLGRLASDAPTPGGGAVAGLVGALASALGSMVVAIAGHRADAKILQPFLVGFEESRGRFLELAAEDEAAFDAVMQELRRPKDDPQRAKSLTISLQRAAGVPLAMAGTCVAVLELLRDLGPHASRHVTSDIGAAAHLARAAGHAALLNVTINVAYLQDSAVTDRLTADRDRLAESLDSLSEVVLGSVHARIG